MQILTGKLAVTLCDSAQRVTSHRFSKAMARSIHEAMIRFVSLDKSIRTGSWGSSIPETATPTLKTNPSNLTKITGHLTVVVCLAPHPHPMVHSTSFSMPCSSCSPSSLGCDPCSLLPLHLQKTTHQPNHEHLGHI